VENKFKVKHDFIQNSSKVSFETKNGPIYINRDQKDALTNVNKLCKNEYDNFAMHYNKNTG
jgi:hypothetical protein